LIHLKSREQMSTESEISERMHEAGVEVSSASTYVKSCKTRTRGNSRAFVISPRSQICTAWKLSDTPTADHSGLSSSTSTSLSQTCSWKTAVSLGQARLLRASSNLSVKSLFPDVVGLHSCRSSRARFCGFNFLPLTSASPCRQVPL
jgi:hypothetical protein